MCHSNRYAYVSHGNGPKAGTPLTIIVAYEFGMGLRPAPDGAGPVVSVRWGWQPFFRNSISFELVKTLVVTDASRTTFRVRLLLGCAGRLAPAVCASQLPRTDIS